MGVIVKQAYDKGDRVVLVEDKMGGVQGDVGTVTGWDDRVRVESTVYEIELDKGGNVEAFPRRFKLFVEDPTEPWPLELGEEFVLTDRYYGEPHGGAGAVVEVRTPGEIDPWGGVGVFLVETGERFRVHWSRLHTPVVPEPVTEWEVTDGSGGCDAILVKLDERTEMNWIDVKVGGDYVMSLSPDETLKLVEALTAARDARLAVTR